MPPNVSGAEAVSVHVPDQLVASHVRYFGDAGRRWVDALPRLAAQCLERWHLRLDGPATFGAVALVLPVLGADGTPAVLKLQPVDDETGGEAAALRSWAGRGAVRLLEHDDESGSMVLERLDATRPLATMPDDQSAVRVIAELLVRLNAVTAPPGLRRLTDIAVRMLELAPTALRALPDPDERQLLEVCAARVRELLDEPVQDRLLHWDLHYDNVLASTDPAQPWLAIDPKPLSGDPGFELLPALWNRWGDISATGDITGAVRRRFDLMTEVLNLDRERGAGWTLGRVLQNAGWDLTRLGEHRLNPAHRAIAEALVARRR